MKYVICLSIIILISFSVAVADYTEDRKIETPASEVHLLDINTGAGTLEIKGEPNLKYITVEAEIKIKGTSWQRAQRFLDEFLVLNVENHGEVIKIDSYFNYNNTFSLASTSLEQVVINLKIKTPDNIKIKIDDSSGDIDIKSMESAIDINDESGEIVISKVGGNLSINDGSGDIALKDIDGQVFIDDSSGDILAQDINGNFEVNDGSGNIDISVVSGKVIVDDGSGDITIDRIEKDVEIIEDSSGDCTITRVDGTVDQ